MAFTFAGFLSTQKVLKLFFHIPLLEKLWHFFFNLFLHFGSSWGKMSFQMCFDGLSYQKVMQK